MADPLAGSGLSREEKARIQRQCERYARAKPLTEEEAAALVAAFPASRIKRCAPASVEEENLRWSGIRGPRG